MLNDQLKTAKDEKCMTNQQLADAANLPVDTVNKILAGTTKNPTMDTLRRLAGALGVTTDKLLEMPEVVELVQQAAELPAVSAETKLYERMIETYTAALEDARRDKRRWFWVSVALAALLLLELIVDFVK